MKRIWSRIGRAGGLSVAGRTLAPLLLASFLFVGSCGGGKHGVVVAFKGWGVSVSAAWCSTPGS